MRPSSDTYKLWFNEGIQAAVNKKVITAAIIMALAGHQIGIYWIAVSASALVLKIGIDVFCQMYTPDQIVDLRG